MKRFALLVAAFLSTSGSARAEEATFNGWTKDQARAEVGQCLAGAVEAGLDKEAGVSLCVCVVGKVVEILKPEDVKKMKEAKDLRFGEFVGDAMMMCIAGPQT